MAVEFHGYIKSRYLWPCVLFGRSLSEQEAEDAAQSTARLFLNHFV